MYLVLFLAVIALTFANCHSVKRVAKKVGSFCLDVVEEAAENGEEAILDKCERLEKRVRNFSDDLVRDAIRECLDFKYYSQGSGDNNGGNYNSAFIFPNSSDEGSYSFNISSSGNGSQIPVGAEGDPVDPAELVCNTCGHAQSLCAAAGHPIDDRGLLGACCLQF